MSTENATEIVDDETSMRQLASFALHELFQKWKTAGFEIPGFEFKVPRVQPNMHPVNLLQIVSFWAQFNFSLEKIISNSFSTTVNRCGQTSKLFTWES